MNVTDLEILILLGIDIVSLSMVAFIFRWSRKALDRIRENIFDILTGESEESVSMIELMAKKIYSSLYRYLNLKIPYQSPTESQESGQESPEINPNLMSMLQGQTGSAAPGLQALAKGLGVSEPDFIKFLPIIQKLMSKNGNSNNTGSVNHDDSW